MTPPSPKTPLETFEAAATKELSIFQDYTASWGYPMNQGAHIKGLENVTATIRQAALAYGEAEVRAKLERLEIRVMSVGFREAMDTLKAELAALPNPDGGEVGK